MSASADGNGEGIIQGRDLILLLLCYFCIGLLLFWYCKPANPAIPPSADLVVEYLDSGVKVYRFERSGDKCYVAVGRLHGYTVDIECRFDETLESLKKGGP